MERVFGVDSFSEALSGSVLLVTVNVKANIVFNENIAGVLKEASETLRLTHILSVSGERMRTRGDANLLVVLRAHIDGPGL